jgi:tRNA(fMet)-specific endonuclease VapC
MELVLDTNAYTQFCRGNKRAVESVQAADEVILPIIALAELRAGFLGGTKAKQNEAVFNRFLKSSRVRVLYPDEATTFHYGVVFNQLRTQGTPVPTNDLWIAALAVQHNLTLLSFDKHFEFLPQILRA